METAAAPRAPTQARRPRATLALICTGYSMVILDATVINVALPSIGGLHGGVTGLAVLGSLVSVSSAFIGGMRVGLVIAACAFLAGAALASGLGREPG